MRLLLLLAAVAAASRHRVPVLETEESDAFRGSWKSGQKTVQTQPPIKTIPGSGRICAYEVLGTEAELAKLPFAVRVTSEVTGEAEIVLKEGEKPVCSTHPYKFAIQAKRCVDEETSESFPVEISVEASNEHSPVFGKNFYEAEVEEGRLYTNILQVKATDADDCGSYGEICRYEITNMNELLDPPFKVSDDGWLSNTLPLNYSKSHNYILSLKAHDCGMHASKEVPVTLKVKRSCKKGIRNVPERVEYHGGSGQKLLAKEAELDLCGLDCDLQRVEAKVALETQHIGRGCDRDSFTSAAQRERCNVDSATVDLLPNPINLPDSHKNEAAAPAEDADSDQVYYFDGEQNAIVVGPETAKSEISSTFTLSFWMKHARHPKSGNHWRENILCASDDHRMNRHHFAVYIRNCKLEMLVRKEKAKGEGKPTFEAAEWRWTLGSVCDDSWHHYTLSFAFPQADLFVDGTAFPTSDHNPEILDDWPMHSTDLKTKLTVGACWHGRSGEMQQFFKGYISSLLYLPGKQEHPGVLQCLHQCKEQLKLPITDLQEHQDVVYGADASEITLRASSLDGFNQLLRQVAYVNLRPSPTPGHRPFSVSAALKCRGSAEPVNLQEHRGYVLVHKTPPPRLTLSASPVVMRTQAQTKAGTAILPDLKVRVETQDEAGEYQDTTPQHKLSSCHIEVLGEEAKEGKEADYYFSSPAALISSFDLDFKHDAAGLLLSSTKGASPKKFQEVLDQIHYFVQNPQAGDKRQFRVQCLMLAGSVKSNQLPVSLGIEKDVAVVKEAASEKSAKKSSESGEESAGVEEAATNLEMAKLRQLVLQGESSKTAASARLASILQADQPAPKILRQPSLSNIMVGEGAAAYTGRGGSAMAGGAVAMVVVVCIGFLLVVIVIGILRMRDAPSGRRGKGGRRLNSGDMEWDDAGMNIIVNPIEGGAGGAEEGKEAGSEFSDSESSDGDSFREEEELSCDGSDDEEELDSVLPHSGRKGLEWDDSTLSPPRHSYRV